MNVKDVQDMKIHEVLSTEKNAAGKVTAYRLKCTPLVQRLVLAGVLPETSLAVTCDGCNAP